MTDIIRNINPEELENNAFLDRPESSKGRKKKKKKVEMKVPTDYGKGKKSTKFGKLAKKSTKNIPAKAGIKRTSELNLD